MTQEADLLTEAEREAISLAGDLATKLSEIVGHGSTRAADLAELLHHVHGIQRAVLAQAAARTYPRQFRLLGDTF
jgi:hypothetical protein